MIKQEKLLWSLMAAILVVLFLLSSTDLIIKEKKTDIYPVSIIISDTSDEYYANFRKGVDKASEEYNVDVNLITLFEKGDAVGQMELLKREIDDGASAVILAPAKQEECARLLDGMVLNSPVIVLGNPFPNDYVRGSISTNYEEEGKKLGKAIAAENTTSLPVWIFTEGLDYGYNREIYDGLSAVLKESGFSIGIYEKKDKETFRKTIEGAVYPDSKEAIIAAIDVDSLDEAAGIIGGSPVYKNYIAGLYGIGSTTKILNALDNEIITGIVAIDQFDAGYTSIQKAVEVVHKKQKDPIVLESYYVNKSNLRDRRLEKLLYPIN
jgi:ribose transport system substrate-binding protein